MAQIKHFQKHIFYSMIQTLNNHLVSKELAEELLSQYQSPLFVYDSEVILRKVKMLK